VSAAAGRVTSGQNPNGSGSTRWPSYCPRCCPPPGSLGADRNPESLTPPGRLERPVTRKAGFGYAAQLVNELVEAADERRLSRLVARYARLDLLCVDELAYFALDARGAELLFHFLTERDEKASVAIASNLPLSEWGQVITDPRLGAAAIDRVTFHAHILETGTNSYRLRTSRTRPAKNAR